MAKEIAVLQGKDGKNVSVYEPGKIVIYRRTSGNWTPLREQNFCIDKAQGLGELRKKIAEAIAFLDECRIFVGLSVVGVPYYELEKAGFSVWEFEGRPEEFLEYILEKEEEASEQKPDIKSLDQLGPVETGDGCYKISLKEIQAETSGVTSKQVLLPFLRQGNSYNLEVICSHVPPWLEAELAVGSISGNIERVSRDEVRVLIARKTCQVDNEPNFGII